MTAPTIVLGLLALLSLAVTAVCAGTVLVPSARTQPPGRRRRGGSSSALPPISVLKPLKGADPDLYENLAALARQDYPELELVLGAADPDDPALEVAERLRRSFPHVPMRIVRGAPDLGLNPKVSNLARLSTFARHDLLLVSDADARPDPGYLRSLTRELARAGELERPAPDGSTPEETARPVGLVASLLVGAGEESLGAACESLQFAGWVTPAVSAADRLADHPCVVGKSMLMPRRALEDAGGWHGVRDVLAEDYVLGRRIREAGYRVVLSRHPVVAFGRRRSLGSFVARHLRWSQMRARIAPAAYLAEPLLNPVPLLLAWAVACALDGAPRIALAGAAAGIGARATLDGLLLRHLRGSDPPLDLLRLLRWGPFKDLLIFGVWVAAAFRRTIVWQGNRLRIGRGSVLRPIGSSRPGGPGRPDTVSGAPHEPAGLPDPLSPSLTGSGRAA